MVIAATNHIGRFGVLVEGESYDETLPHIALALEEAPELFNLSPKKRGRKPRAAADSRETR